MPKNSAAPPLREPEARLDLVEDQEDPELLGEGPHRLVEARLGHDPLGVAEDRLDDDRGDLARPGARTAGAGASMLL